MRRLALPLLTILAMAALAACGSAATPTPSSSTAPPPSVTGSAPASSPAASSPAASGPAASQASAAGCAAAPAGAAATVNVSIKDFKFNPQPVSAKVGDVVAWKNDDSAPHSATMDDGSCDTDTISVGSSALLVFSAPGTYTYHCKVHPTQMKGYTVVVK
jgi:plastocyanin